MRMQAGHLTRRVTFDRPHVLDDGHHGEVQGWDTDVLTVWAHMAYLRGGEDVIAGRLAGRQPVVVTIHRSTDVLEIDETWRMRDAQDGAWTADAHWTGPVFAIRERPKPTQDRLWLELLVEAGVET